MKWSRQASALIHSNAFGIFAFSWLSVVISIGAIGSIGYIRLSSTLLRDGKLSLNNTVQETAMYLNQRFNALESDLLSSILSDDAIHNEIYFLPASHFLSPARTLQYADNKLTEMRKTHEDVIETVLLLKDDGISLLDADHQLVQYGPVDQPYEWFRQRTLFNTGTVWIHARPPWLFKANDPQVYVTKWIADSPSDAILVVGLKLNYIENVLGNISLARGGGLLILDQNGKWIGGSTTPHWLSGALVAHSAAKVPHAVRVGNKTIWFRTSRIGINNWTVVGWVPQSVIYQGMNDFYNWIAESVLLGALAAMIVTLLFAWRLTSPLRKLRRIMNQAEAGDLTVVFAAGHGSEIQALGASFNAMMRKLQELMQRIKTEERHKRTLEFEVLQSQMNPHFLYNALDTIYWMAFAKQDEEISTMAHALGRYFRLSLNNGRDMITLQDELEQVSSYMTVQNIRYGNRISLHLDIAEASVHLFVPKLILQPLVENCILHGFEEDNDGEIWITASVTANCLILTVRDNGVGFDVDQLDLELPMNHNPANRRPKGFALRNLYHRGKLLYGDYFDFQVVSELGKGTMITLVFPVNSQ